MPEDEGQHLQHVYSPAKDLGGPRRFGFHSGAHLVEIPKEEARSKAETLFRQWAPHWDLARPVLIEKSPPNLVRTRFLQSLFPQARFVVIIRHPLEVALAERKRVRSRTLWSLLHHWFICHDTVLADIPYIRRILVLRYEDLLCDPNATLDRLLAFIDLPPAPDLIGGEVTRTASDRYRANWERSLTNPIHRSYARLLVRRFEGDALRHGYSLRDFAPSTAPEQNG